MRYYFQLQFKIWFRTIKHFGISPYIAFPLIVVGFVGLSFLLWERTEMAVYIYAFFALSILISVSYREKLNFNSMTFGKVSFYKIRLIENLICITPFVAFLIYKNLWLMALTFLMGGILAIFFRGLGVSSHTLPSPFRHYLYEYTVGFRKHAWIYLLSYFLLYQSISVDNFNLGMAAIALNFLAGMLFYQDPEGKYFVWVHAMTPSEFLFRKATGAYLYSILSALPVMLILLVFNLNQFTIIFGFFLFMGLYPVMMSQAKYSSYPREITIGHGFILSASFIFPPSILIIIYYFYRQSKSQLISILA